MEGQQKGDIIKKHIRKTEILLKVSIKNWDIKKNIIGNMAYNIWPSHSSLFRRGRLDLQLPEDGGLHRGISFLRRAPSFPSS